MPNIAPRIPPLPRHEWTDEVRDFFAIMEGPEAREAGSRFNIILTFAQHPAMAAAFNTYYKTFLGQSTLTLRQREIITLRVAWRHRCEYEWVQHVAIGRAAGLSDAQIEALGNDGDATALWSEPERLLIRAVDELGTGSRIEDSTWAELGKHLDRRQLMELPFIVGSYTLLCYAVNSMGVQLERP